MSSSRTLSRKRRTSFTCIKPRFGPSIILLYIAASVEQYCDITQVNALPENEGILEVPRSRLTMALLPGLLANLGRLAHYDPRMFGHPRKPGRSGHSYGSALQEA